MRVYEVEMCRRSYVLVKIEAESEQDAKDKAWEEVVYDGSWGIGSDCNWDFESVEDITGESE